MDDTTAYIYEAYRSLNHTSPLNIDCGLLCQQRCCKGDEFGMQLLPGEREILANEAGYRFIEDDGEVTLVCSGHCRRDYRPFACRIFPLFPLVSETENGSLRIRLILDPRAYSFCPLVNINYPLRGIFRYLVRRTTRKLVEEPQIRAWFLEQSAFIEALDDIAQRLALASKKE